jgi:DNA polymerase III psi subunit
MARNKIEPEPNWDDALAIVAQVRLNTGDALGLLRKFLRSQAVHDSNNRQLAQEAVAHLQRAELVLITAQLRAGCPDCAAAGFDKVCDQHEDLQRKMVRDV